MAFLLRKITPTKWQPNVGHHFSKHTADAITGCTRTSENTLSVWASDTDDFNNESVQKLIVALAITMPQPAKIDVIWLNEEQLLENGLTINSTSGGTVFTDVNELHKDIQDLNHEKLGVVSQHIVDQFANASNQYSVKRAQLIDLVFNWMQRDDTFSIDDLSEKWQEALQKKLN